MIAHLRRAANIAAVMALAATCLSGLFLIPAGYRFPGYFTVIRLHAACGYALLITGALAAALWLRFRERPLRRDLLLAGGQLLLASAGLVLFFLGKRAGLLPDVRSLSEVVGSSESHLGAIVASALCAGLVLAALPGLCRGAAEGRVRWLGSAGVQVILLALATGLPLLHSSPRLPGFDATHSLCGVCACVLLVLLIGARRIRLPALPGRILLLPVGVILTALALGAWGWWYLQEFGRHQTPGPGDPDVVLAATPATRAEMLDATRPRIPAALLSGSDRCSQARCHPLEGGQWGGSNHRYALDNKVFRAVVADMVGELGPESANACMNCHDPIGVLAGTVTRSWTGGQPAPTGEGVSCALCHAIISTPSEPKNGLMTVAAPRPYPGDTLEEQERNILLDPRDHIKSFFRGKVLTRDQVCGICHSLEMTPDTWAATDLRLSIPFNPHVSYTKENPGRGSSCTDCHMLITRTRSGSTGSPVHYDHQMAALNPDLHLYAVGPTAEDRRHLKSASTYTSRYMSGTLTMDPALARTVKRIQGSGPSPFPWTAFLDQVRRGPILKTQVSGRWQVARLELTVATNNHRSAHVYPTGSRDFRQVWQEVKVTDARGQVVAHQGKLDGKGRLPRQAYQLGATVLDRRGRPLRDHRVWEAVGVRDVRTIPPGGEHKNRVTLAVPADALSPLSVEVRWNLRHANMAFTRAVLGEEAERFPVHVIGEARIKISRVGPK